MGFSNESTAGGAKFANFSKGMIVTKMDGEKKTFTHITGLLKDIDIQDAEYEGKPYRKIVLFIEHEQGVTQLGFGLSSGYGNAFCRILPNINPAKEVKISGGQTKDKNSDRTYASLFVQQDDMYVKWYYTKENEAGKKVPGIREIKDKKGKVIGKDYSDREDFFERLMVKFLANLETMYGKERSDRQKKHVSAEDVADDLPF